MSEEKLRILVIDDELEIRQLLKVSLDGHGYSVGTAESGEEALKRVNEFFPHLIILDLGLPDQDGIEVLRLIRRSSEVPVIVLTVRDQEVEKIVALDAGADDYITKPFGMGELLARIRVAFRHSPVPIDERILEFDGLIIDLGTRTVLVHGKEVKLTPTEYEILKFLAREAGRVITHRQLLRKIWGEEYEDETHYLRVFIGQLRRKIENDPTRPRHIMTEPGVGYRFSRD